MSTPRAHVACVTTEQALVVAGGVGAGGNFLDTVGVMDTDTKVWSKVAFLPERSRELTATVFRGRLYLAGGFTHGFCPSKSVFTCSVPDLLPPDTLGYRREGEVWEEVSSLPVIRSTLVSFGGHLLAFGGKDTTDKPISTVYRYDSITDS